MSDIERIFEAYGNKLIGGGGSGGGSSEQVQADWDQNDITAVDYIKNKPDIPDAQIQSDWSQTTTTAKDYIKSKPSITSTVTSGSSALITSGGVYTYVDTMITQALSGSY